MKKIRIEDLRGNEIRDITDWAKLYDKPQTAHHWKEHRSAYSVAKFFLYRNGGRAIESRVSDAVGEPVHFERAIPEFQVKFDEFGQGRMHDIALFGNVKSGKSIFVGVEAKVDESFGLSVHDVYLKAKAKQIAGVSTNAPERIERLLAMHFSKPDISMFEVRYQLLYATAGTIAADADISVLYVIVFKTALYSEQIGAKNYRDYIQFMNKVGAVPIKLPTKGAIGHKLELNGNTLICLHEYFEIGSLNLLMDMIL